MFQNTNRLLKIVALFATPLALPGCGGGSNNPPFVTTPTATPTPLPPVTSFKLNARYSQAVGGLGLPPDATYSTGLGQLYTQFGYNVFAPSFEDSTVGITIRKIGALKTGDSFMFSPVMGGAGVSYVFLNYPANVNPRPRGGTLRSRSGTLRIVSLVNHAAVGSNLPTATVKFTLSNVVFGDANQGGGVTLNAAGECTIQDYGDISSQAK